MGFCATASAANVRLLAECRNDKGATIPAKFGFGAAGCTRAVLHHATCCAGKWHETECIWHFLPN